MPHGQVYAHLTEAIYTTPENGRLFWSSWLFIQQLVQVACCACRFFRTRLLSELSQKRLRFRCGDQRIPFRFFKGKRNQFGDMTLKFIRLALCRLNSHPQLIYHVKPSVVYINSHATRK